jgi:hypothetical protein
MKQDLHVQVFELALFVVKMHQKKLIFTPNNNRGHYLVRALFEKK